MLRRIKIRLLNKKERKYEVAKYYTSCIRISTFFSPKPRASFRKRLHLRLVAPNLRKDTFWPVVGRA